MPEIDKRPMSIVYNDRNGNLKKEEISFEDLPYEKKAAWYAPICSEQEISRILDMRNGDDYLLRLLADTIIDNMRAYRVVRRLTKEARLRGEKWSLSEYFSSNHFEEFKDSLPDDLKEKVQQVSFGYIFSNEANGFIFESPFGICSTLSFSLKYFIQFASLALLELNDKVPDSVRLAAMRIAIRTMLEREALDFDIDPRGIIPEDIRESIIHPYPHICMFLAGHEYSHLINGDIKIGNTISKSLIKAHFSNDRDYRKISGYNTSQKNEFAADLSAMNYPQFSELYYSLYYNYTLLWFAMLAIYESVEDYIFPPIESPSHPGAKARYQNILQNAKRPIDFEQYSLYYQKKLPSLINYWSNIMQNDVAENFEMYEMYGSIYLAAPNTEWRGKELKDRIDY